MLAVHSNSVSHYSDFVFFFFDRDGSNNLGIITFCLVFGTVLGTIQSSGSQTVITLFRCIYEVVMKIISGIMW